MTGSLDSIRLIDRDAVAEHMTPIRAIRALQTALRSGFDPELDPPRSIVDVTNGQLLLMPAEIGRWGGQKFATVAPGNPARGLDRIQAIYTLIDAETLSPVALLDGTELTNLRTPAVSAAVADVAAVAEASELVVFGTGPQGVRHVDAMAAIRDLRRVRFVGRDGTRAERAVAAATATHPGLDIAIGSVDDVASADLVVCATTASEPLFDGGLVADHAFVVALGSHDRDRRELPGALLGRSQVIVEAERVARTEAGDVIMAVDDGCLAWDDLVPMRRIIDGSEAVAADRPRVLKTCGMGWQDLAVASALVDALDDAERNGAR
ncbi:ornithine cyclodeaminase family protein [Agromyces intestinalis]|uniref:Ornithine cyclodeaminase family protein n=1 Tax=Agromyces intestinalis TaxID=2592652 RepID=A0A5C1YLN4_9MICO|nr:ornithine cyclodeaminase family protein [Agromyces intestinalis]QEO15732.1 ornithine cyclodeaminase family protein [Agromyces intestinalis]